MLEDIRHHDATPTPEETEWINSNPFTAAVRLAILLVFAVAIGGYVSLYIDLPSRASNVAAAAK